ncbi:MAG TPA: DUF4291 domain-containing protein [Chitinophagales bacterium]|nr:DUF4291 domain-containing protein [Chitinophagales bacterium]
MKIITEKYISALSHLPKEGKYIVGHQAENEIVVYQAYRPAIADFAVTNQFLGGADYSYKRMSWIKPNFLWMMYRSGWATKEGQERILALWISQEDFENILSQAVLSSFDPKYYGSYDHWKKDLDTKEVRLQWDPDHDPYGSKLARRAIQLGLKGQTLETFAKKQLRLIEGITDFVAQQKKYVDSRDIDKLIIPIETVYHLTNNELRARAGADRII